MITVEEQNPSTHAYQRGNYLIYNNNLYKVTAAINIGDTLISDTNIEQVNVGEELKATSGGSRASTIEVPSVSIGTYIYNGQAQGPTVSDVDTTNVTLSDTTAVNAGTYQLVASLNDPEGQVWNDAVNRVFTYTIAKANQVMTLSKDTVSLTNSLMEDTITVTLSTGDGTISAISDNTDVCIVSVVSNIVTVTGVRYGTANVTISVSETTNYNPTSITIPVNNKIIRVYGMSALLRPTHSSANSTRTDDAANFTDPVPAIDNGLGSSPFDDLYPWSEMIVEERAVGTMVKIPKFWYKITYTSGGTGVGYIYSVRIADGPKPGFYVSPAHMDRDDGAGERDFVYVARYQCAGDSYTSVTNETIRFNNLSTSRNNVRQHGLDFSICDFTMYQTIQLLYLVEYAFWDSQTEIGYGPSNIESMTGWTDTMEYHTGTTATSKTTNGHIQYRNIEDLWGGGSGCWVDGFICDHNQAIPHSMCIRPSKFGISTYYTKLYMSYTTSGGYISSYGTIPYFFGYPMLYPNAVLSTSTTDIKHIYSIYSNDNSNYTRLTMECGVFTPTYGNGLLSMKFNSESDSCRYRIMELPNSR